MQIVATNMISVDNVIVSAIETADFVFANSRLSLAPLPSGTPSSSAEPSFIVESGDESSVAAFSMSISPFSKSLGCMSWTSLGAAAGEDEVITENELHRNSSRIHYLSRTEWVLFSSGQNAFLYFDHERP